MRDERDRRVLGAAVSVSRFRSTSTSPRHRRLPRAIAHDTQQVCVTVRTIGSVHFADISAGSTFTMQPSIARMGPPKYAPHADHPLKVLPKVRPFYRFMATGLGASMWFFVRQKAITREWRLTEAVDVPREEGRPGTIGLEASVGSLNEEDGRVRERKTRVHTWAAVHTIRRTPQLREEDAISHTGSVKTSNRNYTTSNIILRRRQKAWIATSDCECGG